MSEQKLSSDRRNFLTSMAASAAALSLVDVTTSAQAADNSSSVQVPTNFQIWLESITGKHRQVYDAPEPNNGMALIWSYVYLLTAAQGYAVPESDVGVVVVLQSHDKKPTVPSLRRAF